MKPPTTFPETAGHLFDLLHEMFGFGFYDDLVPKCKPWHAVRMGEISRLKALMKSRAATPKHVVVAAWHARETGAVILAPHDLFSLIPPAMKAYNTALREQAKAGLADELADAVMEATQAGEHEWAERLIRANDRSALDAWRSR